MSLPLRRLSLNAKSNRKPGTEAPEPACAGRMRLQHSPGMVGTAVWDQRLCETGIVRSQQRATGITLRFSRGEGQDRRLLGPRSPFPYLAAAQSGAAARPCPTPSARMVKKVRRRAMALKRSGPGMDSTKFSVESVCIKRRVGEEMAAGDRSTWGRRGYKVP